MVGKNNKQIVLIVGASGSGKTTLGEELSNMWLMEELVSTTTRKKREGEIEGRDYFFVDRQTFQSIDDFIEESEYGDNLYGLRKIHVEPILNDKKLSYFICNLDGAKKIADIYPDRILVVWLKTNIFTMVKRMIKRGDKFSNVMQRAVHAIKNKELKPPTKVFDKDTLLIVDSRDSVSYNAQIVRRAVQKSKEMR